MFSAVLFLKTENWKLSASGSRLKSYLLRRQKSGGWGFKVNPGK
jgi:hypothetical protein